MRASACALSSPPRLVDDPRDKAALREELAHAVRLRRIHVEHHALVADVRSLARNHVEVDAVLDGALVEQFLDRLRLTTVRGDEDSYFLAFDV